MRSNNYGQFRFRIGVGLRLRAQRAARLIGTIRLTRGLTNALRLAVVAIGPVALNAPGAFATERAATTQNTQITPGTEQYVQIATAKVRETAKHWGKGILDVTYGTPLTVISSEAGWIKVRSANGALGYIHQAALTSRKVVLASGSSAVQIRPDESDVVLAGKGFSAEIESSYKESHKELNFDAVDQMEKLVPTDRELSLFVTEGKLRE